VLTFRRLDDSEVDAACAILTAAAEWLLARGIRQWTEPYPPHLYQQYQDRGENYGLIRDGRLVAIVTMTHAVAPEWIEELAGKDVWWISKLAVAPDCHGQQLGRRMIEAALNHLRAVGVRHVWLDCVRGPLTSFYESLGFQRVVAKVVHFPTGSLDLILMTKMLVLDEGASVKSEVQP
jgi:GNAT superfamily N-acetyltransferase